MSKFFKLLCIGFITFGLFGFILIIFVAIIGSVIGTQLEEYDLSNIRANGVVINSQLYAERYRSILDKYLIEKGYVPLERMVFYLQRKHNVLDTSKLSYEQWEQAYLENINTEKKQMIPTKAICNKLNSDSNIPEFTQKTGYNDSGLLIDVKDLCTDATDESYYLLPYTFPIKSPFVITSIVYEHRNVDLGLSSEAQARTNFHSGWDFAVPIGTDFYSICDGKVTSVTNTQANDLPFKSSGNRSGNYVFVKCNNGLTAQYHHLKYMSMPSFVYVGATVNRGDYLGKTSTTGQSTGPHLHIGLKKDDGTIMDALQYIDFSNSETN